MDTERMPQAEEWYDENGDLIEEKSYTSDFIDDRRPQRIDAQTRLLKLNMGDQRQHRLHSSGQTDRGEGHRRDHQHSDS